MEMDLFGLISSNDIIDIFKDFTFTSGIEFISFRFFVIFTRTEFFGGL